MRSATRPVLRAQCPERGASGKLLPTRGLCQPPNNKVTATTALLLNLCDYFSTAHPQLQTAYYVSQRFLGPTASRLLMPFTRLATL
eukprot:154773-Rhodomonas_salina.1